MKEIIGTEEIKDREEVLVEELELRVEHVICSIVNGVETCSDPIYPPPGFWR